MVSTLLALVVLFTAKSVSGDFIGGYSDHTHHAHITWAFLHVGTKVWTLPFAESAPLAPPYPQHAVTWERYPNPYPPGMSAVFLLPALVGRYVVPMTRWTFGKLIIGWLLVFMTAANWHLAALMRRVKSPVWTAVLVLAWIFNIRCVLLGFYDGAWVLCGLLCVLALDRKKPAQAVLWFVACALINYRAVSFTPFGVVAFWQMMRGDDPRWKKLVVTVVSAVCALAVITTFYWMYKGSPHDKTGAESPLLAQPIRLWTILLGGLGLALVIHHASRSPMAGFTVALSTVLCLVHGGHSWHGMMVYAALAAFSLAERRPVWAQIALGVWMCVLWKFTMGFDPLAWIEELFVFAERGGIVHP